MPDQPTVVDRSGTFVALLQALCAAVLDGERLAPEPGERGVYQQNRWAAARFGVRAELIHPERSELAPVASLTEELLERIEGVARGLGSGDLLDGIDPASSEGDRQLEVGRRDGLEAVCADLVERSLVSG
jgi:gamma-glutamyl:cysteine ligase YbdK (ATP-grasp superfamily)